MPGILFVCTGNLYRSPLAAAFLRTRLNANGHHDWMVDSAGTWTQPGQPVPPETIRAAAGFGASVEGHLSQLVNADLLSRFDLVLVMERGHKEALDQEFPFASQKIHMISQVADHMVYDVLDPMQSGQEIDILASDLNKIVDRSYQSICKLAQDPSVSTPSSRAHLG
jgi:protein-tyrosine phosphatase